MELFPQSTQAGISDDHESQRCTILTSKNESESISQEVVIVSDDDSEDPTSPKERPRCVPRRRWTLLEDCKLVDQVVASNKHKLLWGKIAPRFPHRTSNSCRLRWIKLFKTEDAFSKNRWSEMGMLVGDDVMNQWRVKIAKNSPHFYALISANHPLKRSSVHTTGPDPSIETTSQQLLVVPALDLSLSLATGHNQKSVIASTDAAAALQRPGPNI